MSAQRMPAWRIPRGWSQAESEIIRSFLRAGQTPRFAISEYCRDHRLAIVGPIRQTRYRIHNGQEIVDRIIRVICHCGRTFESKSASLSQGLRSRCDACFFEACEKCEVNDGE
jgi:hypothetical protein